MQKEYKTKKLKEYQERMELKKQREQKDDDKGGKNDDDQASEFPKGTLIRIKNVPEGCNREKLKEKWYATVDEQKFTVRTYVIFVFIS